jgi:methyl-accepting chemotaxis protein
MNRMNRWLKIIMNAGFIIITVAVTAYLIVKMAHFQLQVALTDDVQRHLTIVRDHKKRQVEAYFQHLSQQLQLYAHLPIVIEAMRELKQAFSKLSSELAMNSVALETKVEFRTALLDYYFKEWKPKYESKNAHFSPDLAPLLENLADNHLALQYHWLIKPLPLVQNTNYLQSFHKYHPHLAGLQTEALMEDLLLLEATEGQIIYATRKNIALATSLTTGIFADSKLGEAFSKMAAALQGTAIMVDFFPYLPAYDAPTAFVATPIFADEQKIGILMFQINSQALNSMMTNDYLWSLDEVGNTGETYLIAADSTMRNNSRFLVEEPENYLLMLHERGLPEATIATIARKKTSVGLQPVTTAGAKAALAGVTGFELYEEYHDKFVLSAYAPVTVMGLSWAIFATLPEQEAFLLLDEITTLLTYGAIQIVGGVIFLALMALMIIGLVGNSDLNEESTTKRTKTYTIEEIVTYLNQLR